MPAVRTDWLIERFHAFDAGDDPGFTARYLRRVWVEARSRGLSTSRMLDAIEGTVAGSATTRTVVDR